MLKKGLFSLCCTIVILLSGCQDQSFDPATFQLDESLFTSEKSQSEMNQKAQDEYKRAEKNLNRMVKTIIEKYSNNTDVVDNLQKAQDAWKQYREFHMKSIFPGPTYVWGSAYSMSYYIEMSRVTWLRARELYKWVSPGKAGETYPDQWHGSYGMYRQVPAGEK
ncbi:MAG: DUF1311 domain-containing protein [Spirochaetales bacterium]|nr:DUF1311 domain-containing protein [Spirochaetales bacterium]